MNDETWKRPLSWTTVEESQMLLDAGLPAKTADMFYSRKPTGASEYSRFPDSMPIGKCDTFTSADLPCWSLGRLLELLKPYQGQTWEACGTLDNGALFSFEGRTNSAFQKKTLIESVVCMTEWLLELSRRLE